MEKVLNFWKKEKKAILILGVVFAGAIFLRTYRFHDLLRFNADQSRDAEIVTGLVKGKRSFLILGPKAGGTEFRLGPVFYYFQAMSGKVFGTQPDQLAYPDLAFSILGIGIIFLFLRQYFSQNISLALSGVVSVSAFAVKYSRFAWNPNATVFFVPLFLLSLYKLGDRNGKRKILWALLCGSALGICIQLHTILMVALPIVVVVFFVYLWRKKISLTKSLFFVVLATITLNLPQIVYEIKNDGINAMAFFAGVGNKSDRNDTFSILGVGRNLSENLLCNVSGNFYAISSWGESDQCGIGVVAKIFAKNKKIGLAEKGIRIALFFESLVFSLGGYVLWVYYFRRETSHEKKRWIFLTGVFVISFFVIFTLLAEEISLRFYLMLLLQPLLLFGFWIKFLTEKWNKAVYWIGLIFLVFIILNLMTVKNSFSLTSGDFENATLSEVEFMTNFITQNSNKDGIAHLNGSSHYLFKSSKSIQFLAEKSGFRVAGFDKQGQLVPNDSFYYISKFGSKPPEGVGKAQKEASFGHFTIFKVESL